MTSVTKPLERPRVCGGVRPGRPGRLGLQGRARSSHPSREPAAGGSGSPGGPCSRVVGERPAVIARVDHRLHDALRALEAVVDRGGVVAVVEALRADHDERRDPVEVDALGDRDVAGELVGGDDEGRDVRSSLRGGATRFGDQAVVDAAVADEEQRHGVAGVEGGDHRPRRRRRRAQARARRRAAAAAPDRLRVRLPRRSTAAVAAADSPASPSSSEPPPILPSRKTAASDEEDADEGDLGHRVFVQLLSHTFAYLRVRQRTLRA